MTWRGSSSIFHRLGPLDSMHVHADVLGQAYEWLIANFAATSGNGGGEFYTPAEVGKLAAGLLEPHKEAHIYDPSCGQAACCSSASLAPTSRASTSARCSSTVRS